MHRRTMWTRRGIVAMPVTALAAAPLLAAQQPAPAAAADAQKRAGDALRRTQERLAQIEVPINTAPAFVFRP